MSHRHHVHNHGTRTATPEFVVAVGKLERLRGSRVLLLVDRPGGMIDECTYADVRLALQKFHPPKLDLLLHSHGGLPGEAFKIGRFLHARSGTFSALIPEYAKSAATLISLGADEIVMTRDAEMGPIDTQIADSREAEGAISALQEFKGLEAVSSFCQSFLDTTAELIQSITARSINESVQMAAGFAPPLLRPLFEQVDPRSLGRFKRALEITESYGERLLRARGCQTALARKIVHHLVYNYPSHDFVIQHDEAAGIGLPTIVASDEIESAMDDVLNAAPDAGWTGFATPITALAKTSKRKVTKEGPTATNRSDMRRTNGKATHQNLP